MGNFNFTSNNIPQKGQVCEVIDIPYTTNTEIPKNVYGQGAKVKVLESKKMYCSRQGKQDIYCSLVQLQNGKIETYLSCSLKPLKS